MPRKSKGPHLWFRKERRDPNGRLKENGVWLILDDGKHVSTGFAEAEVAEAQLRLAQYVTERYQPPRREQDRT